MGFFKGGLKSIKIELKACNVSVTGVNSVGLEGIQYTGSQSRTPQVSFKDGALVITEKPAAGGRKGLSVSNMSLDIKISKDADLRFLDIKLNSGDISVNDVSADWFSGVIGAGNITLTDSNFLKAFPAGLIPKEAEDIRWMIEEYRISLFDQSQKTLYSVSDKRIRKKMEEIREQSLAVK